MELSFLLHELGSDLEFLGVLGRGRAARVYLAREKHLDRLVAVKVLSRDLSGDPVAMARFEREGKAAASLNHPNVVAVYHFGILSNNVPFQIVQYVKGGTLEDRITAEGPLPESEARRILGEIADALAAAHRQGFVHRDLRPGNVLCDEEACRVLVSDFGLAGILPYARKTSPRLTRVGELLSHPKFASPELLRGEELSEGTDIYALGILGYEVLTGHGPFPGRSDRAVALAHLTAQPPPVTLYRPGVARDLSDLLERCLAKDPSKRPAAAFLSRAIRGSHRPESDSLSSSAAQAGWMGALLQRRFPQILVATSGAGWLVLQLVDQLVQQTILLPVAYPFALNTVLAGIGSAAIVAWFHGKKGRQRVTPLELVLLSALGLAWLAAGVLLLR